MDRSTQSDQWPWLRQAADDLGVNFLTLRRGAESGRIPAAYFERVENPDAANANHRVRYRFDVDAIRGDPALRCRYPRCSALAPGPSGRCGDHNARGEPAVELVCQYEPCGKTFTRPVSWLREREGRGHYCSNECKGKAFDEAHPGRLEMLNPEGAHEHHAAVAAKIKAHGKLDRYRAQRSPLNLYGYSATVICASIGETTVIDGSPRWQVDPAELVAWDPPWRDQLERRVDIAFRRTNDPGVKGRLGGSIKRKWTREQALKVLRLRAEGKTLGQIEYRTGLTRRQVRYILDG